MGVREKRRELYPSKLYLGDTAGSVNLTKKKDLFFLFIFFGSNAFSFLVFCVR